MVRKSPTGENRCRVTFELPGETGATTVHLCGDFNDWSTCDTPLTTRKNGRFSVTMTLPRGRRFHYRYLIDGERWENDWAADDYEPNEFGGDDSVLDLTDGFERRNGAE